MWCLEKLLDKVYEHLYFEKTANPVVELDVPGFFCHHNGSSPEGWTNITPGDRSPKGEGTRGKRHLCFGRPEGGTTYGSLKSSAYHRISRFDRNYQWVPITAHCNRSPIENCAIDQRYPSLGLTGPRKPPSHPGAFLLLAQSTFLKNSYFFSCSRLEYHNLYMILYPMPQGQALRPSDPLQEKGVAHGKAI